VRSSSGSGGSWADHVATADAPRSREGTLETRLRRLEDEAAVRDTIVRYAYYHDAGELERKLALHHPDCVLHHRTGDLRGMEAIRAFFAAGPPNAGIRDMTHYVANTLVRFPHADTAVASSLYVWTETKSRTTGETGGAVGGGWYLDRLVSQDDTWLFIERTIERAFDFFVPSVTSFGTLALGEEGVPGPQLQQLIEEGRLVPRPDGS
jgi:hypothetical protein